jgi:hypothetical protein
MAGHDWGTARKGPSGPSGRPTSVPKAGIPGEGEGEEAVLILYLLEINKYTWIIYFPESRV